MSEVWQNLVAGGSAGIFADTLLHPFDTVNTRMKVQAHLYGHGGFFKTARKILLAEGARGLYAGLGATLLSAMPSTAVYFAVRTFHDLPH